MKWLELRVPPPLVAGALALIMWGAARLLPALDFSLPAQGALTAAAAVVGLCLGGAAILQFLLAATTMNPMKPDAASVLVVRGVYRLSRNPMYVADLALVLAWALWLGNAAAFALVPTFVAYINRFQIAPEERVLEGRFGPAFADYRRAVRRWL